MSVENVLLGDSGLVVDVILISYVVQYLVNGLGVALEARGGQGQNQIADHGFFQYKIKKRGRFVY